MDNNTIDKILLAVVPSLFTLLGITLAFHFRDKIDNKKIEADNKRWYAGYFLQRKIEKLEVLYDISRKIGAGLVVSIIQCYRDPNSSLVSLSKIKSYEEDNNKYFEAHASASKYLNDLDNLTMDIYGFALYDGINILKELKKYGASKGARNVHKNKIMEVYTNIQKEKVSAEMALKHLLSPKILTDYDNKYSTVNYLFKHRIRNKQ